LELGGKNRRSIVDRKKSYQIKKSRAPAVMEKEELVDKIDAGIEKIIEHFTEVLQYLISDTVDECEELHNLLFAKRRIIELIDSAHEIHHYLTRLKYMEAGDWKGRRVEQRTEAVSFDGLFAELNKSMGHME
jgi:hypothetical protein